MARGFDVGGDITLESNRESVVKKLLTFRTTAVDAHTFPAGVTIPAGSVFEYFRDTNDYDDNDVTKQGEEAIIRWLLATRFRYLLLDALGVEADAFIDHSVKQPVVENPQDKPGDIDILICPSSSPHRAMAFQCKPVIVKSLNEREDDDVKRLRRIPDLVTQANCQRNRFGFYRNYLAILIKVDGRKKLEVDPLIRGANPETFQTIYEFPDRERVHKDVGIVFIEIVQPTGKSFDDYVTVGICVETEAARLSQTPNLTNRIEELMRRKGAIIRRG
jgi:hypothetical protein